MEEEGGKQGPSERPGVVVVTASWVGLSAALASIDLMPSPPRQCRHAF